MGYSNDIVYDFKSPCIYPAADPNDPEATAKDKYLTACYELGDGVSIDRYRAVSVSGGVASDIATQTPTLSSKSKYSTAHDWDEHLECEVPAVESWTIQGTATKYWAPEKLETITSTTLSLYQTQAVSASDFAGGGLKLKVVFGGKSYYDRINTVIIEVANSDQDEFDEGDDYTSSMTTTKVEGHDEVEVTVAVKSGSALETYLATKSVKVAVILSAVATATEIPYTYSYVPHAGGAKTDLVIVPTPPAGYDGVVANMALGCRQYTLVECAGITQYAVPATGPRKVAVWTSGTFHKADIPNYQASFDSDNMAFI